MSVLIVTTRIRTHLFKIGGIKISSKTGCGTSSFATTPHKHHTKRSLSPMAGVLVCDNYETIRSCLL